jgi:predicted AAA+ superfamily ATPase
MNSELKPLLLHKYAPLHLDDFEQANAILKEFIEFDIIKILFTSKQSNGKTSLIKAVINEYYKDADRYKENILFINNIKYQ